MANMQKNKFLFLQIIAYLGCFISFGMIYYAIFYTKNAINTLPFYMAFMIVSISISIIAKKKY
ncbi:hypothetical protein D0T84_05445, partial [Dysgonomonas sp. 521]|nr:hypothetical protein [Dysgonomonas sp. 521]